MGAGRAKSIKQDYDVNTWLIQRITEGLSHEESVLQLPFPTNCLNWILGHIIARRNTGLELVGAQSIWGEEILARYRSGSEPIRDIKTARRLEDLMEDLAESQRRIVEALDGASEAALERSAETDRGAKPVWQHLQGLHWHETFHIGQLEVLKDYALARRSQERNHLPSPR
jgi:hypothetical protein